LNSMFFVRDPMSDEKLDRDSHSWSRKGKCIFTHCQYRTYVLY
jgi:hypothetical protein